jgi:hypothetical protein
MVLAFLPQQGYLALEERSGDVKSGLSKLRSNLSMMTLALPADLRKRFAFPKDVGLEEPLPRSPSADGPRGRRGRLREWSESRRLFRRLTDRAALSAGVSC